MLGFLSQLMDVFAGTTTCFFQSLSGCWNGVVTINLEPRFDQVACHGRAHDAQADDADLGAVGWACCFQFSIHFDVKLFHDFGPERIVRTGHCGKRIG